MKGTSAPVHSCSGLVFMGEKGKAEAARLSSSRPPRTFGDVIRTRAANSSAERWCLFVPIGSCQLK